MDKLILLSPQHLKLEMDGYGQFPDSYSITEAGLEVIKEYFNKIKSNEKN